MSTCLLLSSILTTLAEILNSKFDQTDRTFLNPCYILKVNCTPKGIDSFDDVQLDACEEEHQDANFKAIFLRTNYFSVDCSHCLKPCEMSLYTYQVSNYYLN